MIKQIAIQELARLQAKHRDLVQDVEMGETKHFLYIKFWYLENRIKHWNRFIK